MAARKVRLSRGAASMARNGAPMARNGASDATSNDEGEAVCVGGDGANESASSIVTVGDSSSDSASMSDSGVDRRKSASGAGIGVSRAGVSDPGVSDPGVRNDGVSDDSGGMAPGGEAFLPEDWCLRLLGEMEEGHGTSKSARVLFRVSCCDYPGGEPYKRLVATVGGPMVLTMGC